MLILAYVMAGILGLICFLIVVGIMSDGFSNWWMFFGLIIAAVIIFGGIWGITYIVNYYSEKGNHPTQLENNH